MNRITLTLAEQNGMRISVPIQSLVYKEAVLDGGCFIFFSDSTDDGAVWRVEESFNQITEMVEELGL